MWGNSSNACNLVPAWRVQPNEEHSTPCVVQLQYRMTMASVLIEWVELSDDQDQPNKIPANFEQHQDAARHKKGLSGPTL
jgi:hypothetical protein